MHLQSIEVWKKDKNNFSHPLNTSKESMHVFCAQIQLYLSTQWTKSILRKCSITSVSFKFPAASKNPVVDFTDSNSLCPQCLSGCTGSPSVSSFARADHRLGNT